MSYKISKIIKNNSKLYLRYLSTKQIPQKEIKYTNTINLPKTDFPSRLSAQKRKEVEQKILEVDIFSLIYCI